MTRQKPDERAAVQCWLLANFMAHERFYLSSPTGPLLRGNPMLAQHLDNIEMLPCPIPIEESSLSTVDESAPFEPDELHRFADRFIFFDVQTGQIRPASELRENRSDWSQFSPRARDFLELRYRKVVDGLAPYSGWSICVDEADLHDDEQAFLGQFGLDERLIQNINYESPMPIPLERKTGAGRPRIRDDAGAAYNHLFADGHEAQGLTFKQATNAVSDDLGRPISEDTLRRALGKRR